MHRHAPLTGQPIGRELRGTVESQIIVLSETDALLEFPVEDTPRERATPSIVPDRAAPDCRAEASPAIGYAEFIQMLARSVA